MLNVDRAILHVFDFDSGSTYFSERPLDLDVRSTKSFVQRHLRKISSNAESRHGSFAPDSGFAVELQRYLAGEREFVEFSVEIAQWFWEELRRAEDLEQCDLLVADFTDTDVASGEEFAELRGGFVHERRVEAAADGELFKHDDRTVESARRNGCARTSSSKANNNDVGFQVKAH